MYICIERVINIKRQEKTDTSTWMTTIEDVQDTTARYIKAKLSNLRTDYVHICIR